MGEGVFRRIFKDGIGRAYPMWMERDMSKRKPKFVARMTKRMMVFLNDLDNVEG